MKKSYVYEARVLVKIKSQSYEAIRKKIEDKDIEIYASNCFPDPIQLDFANVIFCVDKPLPSEILKMMDEIELRIVDIANF